MNTRAVSPVPVPEPSAQGDGDGGYDHHQISAVLRQCPICAKWVYFTNHAREQCRDCRERER